MVTEVVERRELAGATGQVCGGKCEGKCWSEADGIYYGEHKADGTSVAHVGLC